MSRIGCHTSRNCGTAKSNSPWKVDRPIKKPPASMTAPQDGTAPAGGQADQVATGQDVLQDPHPARGAPGALLARGKGPLGQQDEPAQGRERRGAEQDQVRGPPQGHVLPEDPVP